MVLPRNTVSPLDGKFPIVELKYGTPSLQFLRLWQQMFGNEAGTYTTVVTLQTTKADKSTQIIAGTALDGGGDLSADVTIDHSDSGVTAGTYGDASNVAQITVDDQGHITDVVEVAIAGSGGGSTPTVRASNIQSSSASSYTVNWPTGTVAGDVVIIFAGHGFAVTTPTGWLQLDNKSGSNWNGAVFAKVMTSADITAGSVSVTTAGAFNGVVAAVTLDGSTVTSYISTGTLRSSTGATAVSADPAIQANSSDLCLVFLSNRANNTADGTNSGSSSLQTVSASNASGCLESVSGDLTPLGFVAVGTFSSSGTGYYIAGVVFRG